MRFKSLLHLSGIQKVIFGAVLAAVSVGLLNAQGPGNSQGNASVVVPDTSIEHAGDAGVRAHTNHLIRGQANSTATAPAGETPGSLGCVYAIPGASTTTGCPISSGTANTSGGAGVIAIVDAFDYSTAVNDFYVFSNQFGLPCTRSGVPSSGSCPDQFQVVYSRGKARSNCGWAQESALDIEWAHALAPNAKIVLVLAPSNFNSDLYAAVDLASKIVQTPAAYGITGVQNPGRGEVSMSWGSGEFSSEANLDSHFTASGVVYFAASGDSGGKVIYPSASPYVVSAGGTTVNRSGGLFSSETAWSGSGGGPSQYELRPSYQNGVSLIGSMRGTPDFSFDANPYSGVSVYDSTPCQGFSGWMVFGGTSVSSPALAGIVNLAGSFAISGTAELSTIYSGISSTNFRDIISGSAGSFSAGTGWDFVTGVGSNKGLSGK